MRPSTAADTFGAEAEALFQELASGSTEGILVLDKRGRIAWVNEAALRMHDAHRMDELGDTAVGYRKRYQLHYRTRRKLPAGQYPIDRLMRAGGFHDLCVHVTRKDDDEFHRVFQFRGLALDQVADSCGALVLQDATQRFEAQERFERTFDVNPAPAIICRVSDLRYIKVNNGFVQMTGYSQRSLLGSSSYEIDVLRQAEQRDKAIECLKHGQTIPQMEAVLRQADGSDKYVVVAGQPLDVDGEPCMLFTFIDLTARKQVEQDLRQSEERFSTAFRLAPVPMALSSIEEGKLLEINEAFLQVTGHADKEDANQALSRQQLWVDPQTHQKLAGQLERNSSLRNVELQLRLRSGQFLDCLASAEIVTIGSLRCILWVVQDITQRKRTEAELMQAIEAVMQDASWFSRSVVEKLAQLRGRHGAASNQTELADLTLREQEILHLMCQGKEDREISEALGISRHTVRNHVAAIYSKIGVHRRGAAIIWALERGIGG
ncbi:helix-turn-helix transcriptional regulator [Pusillimonas noertemannii]|uniref:LuxR family transcriptional regulator n=1 Tax=Pusillimonas noertemannii TaxID=305977 RepID=A0A2U1CKG0_9BURK|nr:helix-turn-helix transcriptional regulator [Pusillimonas noertemannii]NYT69594.1 helix-turn-helix transcriptional regulator [Pusillimonas noertemannii]PVY61482.1 LuxR family transcriptional regulator [Pusillimonas noertemannii]TFL08926.1 helix-turn-helix transcriptional regulator [Pusillimonas noertemannii]